MRDVVVPFDFSPQAERALSLALQGYPYGASNLRVQIVHVVDESLYRKILGPRAIPSDTAVKSYLDEYVARQRAELGPRAVVPHATIVRHGEPIHEVILQVERSVVAGLIVGGQGHGGIRERIVGRFAQRVLRRCPVPMYVVKDTGPDPSTDPIMCAVDFALGAREALRQAFALSRRTRRPLELVHVVELVAAPYIDVVDVSTIGSDADRDLLTFEREMIGEHAAVRRHVVHGEPAASIARVAQENGAGLVVLGWHGHSAAEHVILGSVSESVAAAAPHDVWIVR